MNRPKPSSRTGIRAIVVAFLAVLAAALAVPGESWGTILLRLDLERMSRDAAMVVQGHVAWDYSARKDGTGDVYTYTGIEVTRCVAGDCPETVTLRHKGGTVGQWTLFISGMPRFQPGQEVLLFLRPDYEGEPGYHAVLGMAQGHFLVEKNAKTGKKVAAQQLGGVGLAQEDGSGKIFPVDGVKPIVMEIEALVAKIREARAAAGTGGGGK